METSKSGVHVYLALANLLQLVSGDGGTGLLDERTLARMPLDLAFIIDFTTRPLTGLASELFTAVAVGGLLIKASVEEKVILPEPDAERGLAVRLHAELSPTLALLVHQLDECMAKAVLMRVDDQLSTVGTLSLLGHLTGGIRPNASALLS